MAHAAASAAVVDISSVLGFVRETSERAARVVARKADGREIRFEVKVLLLTPKEIEYFRNGGILHYVLRQLAAKKA